MIIRRRLGGAICLFPYCCILILVQFFNSVFLENISFILLVIGIIFSNKIYDLIFLDGNSPCAFYAGKMAIENGYSPKGQNGIIWNPNQCKISEIYKLYPNSRNSSPQAGTAGFMFYTCNKDKTKSKHFEFYDYTNGGEYFDYYNFYFHPYKNNGDKITCKKMKVEEIDKNMIFVSLEII